MNKLYVLLLFLLLGVWNSHAQTTTENFESVAYGATTFTNNGQQFVISTQAGGPFYITSFGVNGGGCVSNADMYGEVKPNFTIATNNSALFQLKSMQLAGDGYQSNLMAFTIIGKRNGNLVFTVTSSFVTNFEQYKLVDMATFGGQNNANAIIDSYSISSSNGYLILMDDMTWQKADINSSVTALSSFTTCAGTVSATQNFTVSGTALTAGIVVTAPNGYEVSTTAGTGYAASVTLPQTSGSVAETTVYARLTATASGTPTGNITLTSTGKATVNVAVNGTVSAIVDPINKIVCVGGGGTFNVSATGSTTYQWQVDTNASGNFTNISNGASYSGVTSNTLTITGATANMSGYRYRAVATGTCTMNSNYATLTVTSIIITGTKTNVSCFEGTNGAVSVVPSGGVPSYTYSWNTNPVQHTAMLTGLAAGTYTVTVTDANGCTGSQSFVIGQPTPLTASATTYNVRCHGGSSGFANITVSGGTGTYTYVWGHSGITTATATGLSVGNYTVTATDGNGCTIVRNFTVIEPDPLEATTSQVNVACNGGANGSATVNVTGGREGYTYSWSPSGGTAATASGLTSGSYTVTITDINNCSITKDFTISQPAPLAATTTQNNVSCNGGSNATATVSVSGGTGTYTYSWSP
ncbi:beta strand repeat-containing protein [Flavobacterium kingsejongi]|nr:SprB repeat-containing protein [Flavobacterium kingsejongi]